MSDLEDLRLLPGVLDAIVFEEYEYRWIVMADLEDDEFCLVIRSTG